MTFVFSFDIRRWALGPALRERFLPPEYLSSISVSFRASFISGLLVARRFGRASLDIAKRHAASTCAPQHAEVYQRLIERTARF